MIRSSVVLRLGSGCGVPSPSSQEAVQAWSAYRNCFTQQPNPKAEHAQRVSFNQGHPAYYFLGSILRKDSAVHNNKNPSACHS